MVSLCWRRCSLLLHHIGLLYSHLRPRWRQALQAALPSSHFLRRKRQVKHPRLGSVSSGCNRSGLELDHTRPACDNEPTHRIVSAGAFWNSAVWAWTWRPPTLLLSSSSSRTPYPSAGRTFPSLSNQTMCGSYDPTHERAKHEASLSLGEGAAGREWGRY